MATVFFLWVSAMVLLFGIGFWTYPSNVEKRKQRAEEKTASVVSKHTTELVIALIERGEDWIKDTHHWWHPSGVNVWIANQAFGLGVVLNSTGPNDYATGNSNNGRAEVLTKAQRDLIWQAVQTGHASTAGQRLLNVSQKVQEMYELNRP